MTGDFDVVTGAFGYSGAAIARELQAAGRRVRTLTGHPERALAGTGIEVRPLDFADPAALTESLRGARTLYNTYWVRFPHGTVDHPVAVARSRVLFQAAAAAGVSRIVHVSITNPSPDSPYPYFRGKAAVELALRDLGISHAVLRPAILFGGDGVLINNIAWLLRRLPVFAVGGTGEYRIRPIHVDDLARLAVRAGSSAATEVIDAVGPERPAFLALVQAIRVAVGSRSRVVRVPGALIPPAARMLGLVLRDTLLTAEEYQGMADGLADTDGPATGETSLSRWITDHGDTLGRVYANDTRHVRAEALPEGAGVGGDVDLAEPVHRDQGVDLGGGDRRVAEQFLDHPDVGASVEHVGGERVPQRVRRHAGHRVKPGPAGGGVQHPPGALPGEAAAAGVEEHRRACRDAAGGRGQGGPGPDQVRLERPHGVAAYRHHPVLAALADQPHHGVFV